MDLSPQNFNNLTGSEKELAKEVIDLRDKYQKLESRHTILCQLDKLADNIDNTHDFLKGIYQILAGVIRAEKFHVAFFNPTFDTLTFPYFVDDTQPISNIPVAIDDYKGSLLKYVIDTKKPLLANKASINKLVATSKINPVDDNLFQWLGAPLIKDGYIMGCISVQNSQIEKAYNEHDLDLLTFISKHLVIGLNRLQELEILQTAIDNRTSELMQQIRDREKSDLLKDSLYKISELANDADLEISEFYSNVHKIVGRLINAPNFYIAKYSEKSDLLTFVYYVDHNGKNINTSLAPRKAGKHLTELVISRGKALLLNTDDIEKLYQEGEIGTYDKNTAAWLGVPLIHTNHLLGVMVIQSYQKKVSYTSQDRELLNYVSDHISSAIRRRELAAIERQSHGVLEQKVKIRTLALEEEISQRKLVEKQLTHTASHDGLTGLANRDIFIDLLNHTILSTKHFPERLFAILFLDLDRFKIVNDSLGHHAGDSLLKTVAKELVSMVRSKDTVARFGGDEFVILIENLDSKQEAYDVAERITKFLSTPFVIEDHPVYIGTSIGILFNNERYDNADFMLRDADTAMYHAKENGRGRYEVFDSSMHSNIQNALSLELDIRNAIKAKEFTPYFQPIVDLETGAIKGFEALARWESKKRGFVFPNDFIPLAEERNLVMPIDLQILEKSCRQLKKWQTKFGCDDIYISCNLYGDHFFSLSLAEDISKILEKVGVEASRLRIELTERALLNNSDVVLGNMKALKKLGVRILLDDFGTGYSSLSYLHLFPIDVLKIDRSFITNVHDHESHQAIIKTIIDLATNLNMATVGEGIESLEDAEILNKMECRYGQGYYFSKPMKASEAEKLLFSAFDVKQS
jgi:diguanylate cyclase (GGDEF)-like protein